MAEMWGVDPNAADLRAQVLEKLRMNFEETGNVMLPWNAIRWARDGGLDMPKWVVDFFCDRAIRINRIVVDDLGKEEAHEVGRALGFGAAGKGSTSAGAELRQRSRDWQIAVRIAGEMADGTTGKDAAVVIAAEIFKVSPATAYRAHNDYGVAATLLIQTYVDEGSRNEHFVKANALDK
jgi:hypothetical protein